MFEGSGRKFVLVAADMHNWDADAWWRENYSARFVANEYLKLACYMATKNVEPKIGPT